MTRHGTYLSIVVAARNDNYGGDFLGRLQVFVTVLLSFLKEVRARAELVIVEWNPPEGRPRLADVVNWPRQDHIPVRIVEVSPSVHARWPNAQRMGMFEYVAKNAGIRRAHGTFILCTNPDLIITKEMVAYLASESLSASWYYRADRYELDAAAPVGLSNPEEIVRYARKRVAAVSVRCDPSGDVVRLNQLMRCWSRLTGRWPSSLARHLRGGRASPGPIVFDDENAPYEGIHTNASGDFILASASAWHEIAGFPESLNTYIHLDSYGCHQLKALGLRQMLFVPPCMIFHPSHERSEQAGRPAIARPRWEADLRRIREGKLGPRLNDDAWGLRDDDLAEYVIDSTGLRHTV